VEQSCGGAPEVFHILSAGKGEEDPTAILYFLDPPHNFCVPLIFDTERFKRNPHMPFRRCLRGTANFFISTQVFHFSKSGKAKCEEYS
jgi:hypothetical protein